MELRFPFPTGTKKTQTELKKYLQYQPFADQENPIDETALTDQELQDRLAAFQQLGQTGGELDKGEIQRQFQDQLRAYGVNPVIADNISGTLSDYVLQKGGYPSATEFFNDFKDGIPFQGAEGKTRITAPLENFFNDQEARNYFSNLVGGQVNAPDTKTDVKRIQDLLGQRGQKAQAKMDLESFVNQIPSELSGNTEKFYQGQREQGIRTLEDFLNPQIRSQLAARGLLTSGDLEASLAEGAGDILSPIEQQYNQSRADDLAFFENAAYQTHLQKTIDANQNLASQINFERGNALNAQSNRFNLAQQNISDSANLASFRRQQQSNLQAQETRLKKQQDLQSAQNKARLYSGIGSSVGQIGGALIGNAIAPGIGGIVAGGAIGHEFGGGVGTAFSKTGP